MLTCGLGEAGLPSSEQAVPDGATWRTNGDFILLAGRGLNGGLGQFAKPFFCGIRRGEGFFRENREINLNNR